MKSVSSSTGAVWNLKLHQNRMWSGEVSPMTSVFWMDWLFSWFRLASFLRGPRTAFMRWRAALQCAACRMRGASARIALLPGGFSPVVFRRSPNLP